MLSITLTAFNQACAPISGGIARIWLFDGADFDFTQAAPVAGLAQPYTAVALRTGATSAGGAKMYPVKFEKKEAEYTYTQSRKGSSTKYEHQLAFRLAGIGQLIAQWNMVIDSAGACAGVAAIIQLNSGKLLVAGEQYVNGDPIDIPMEMVQDGTKGGSGKLHDDPNGQDTIIKGDLGRSLFEFTGGVAAIVALQ